MPRKNKEPASQVKVNVKRSLQNHDKFSSFMLTVNTNKKGEDSEALVQAMDNLVGSEDEPTDLTRWIKYIEGDSNSILEFDVDVGELEFSKKAGYGHIHVFISIKHRAKIQLDVQKIKEEFTDELGYEPYVNVKLQNDYRARSRDYTSKSKKNS